MKLFSFRDFNLEKKIEALPSLSLEEFQAMKKQQRTKKKKTLQKVGISTKRLQHEHSAGQNGKKTESQKNVGKALLVGSQKRKARKQSITRNTLTLDSATADADQGNSKGVVFRMAAYCEFLFNFF